jgi:predicted site-specific integrase-resolvase
MGRDGWTSVIESWTHQEIGPRGTPIPAMVRAAEYVRMSTEHQKYSTENQAEVIRQYAGRRGLEVVRTYADEGKSGLRLDGRDALKQHHR